jgi:sortase (surface protein transpeptidase)
LHTARSSHLAHHVSELLPYSKPTNISIPAIAINSSVISVGKNTDGTLQTPGAQQYNKAAWYHESAAPGQLGSSVIEGHLDYIHKGPAVFFRLGELKPGDKISVEREDGMTATFIVYELDTYKKDTFPTARVYGTTGEPVLVLITCGGEFSHSSGEYDSNVVVFASLH